MIKKRIGLIGEWSFLKTAVVLFILHIPFLIAYYPGLLIYDTASSILQFYGEKTFAVSISDMPDAIWSNHHMVALTLVFGGFVKLGELLGNQNIGVFLYVLLQVIFASLVASYAIIVVRRHLNKAGQIFLVVMYGLYPLISFCEITMSKDSIFMIFFLLYAVLLFRFEESKGEVLGSKRFILMMIFTGLGMTLTKQQGVYIVLITALVILITMRKQVWRIICTFILPSLLYHVLIVMILLPVLGVAPSGKQEMLGTMFQQTAAAVIDHGDSITEEEKAAIEKVLPYDELEELYDPYNQDSVKFQYRQTASSGDRAEYLMTWFKMFFKYPDSYFKATFTTCGGFFFPNGNVKEQYIPYQFNRAILKDYDQFELYNVHPPIIYRAVYLLFYCPGKVPFFNIFYMCWFYVWMSLICGAVIIIRQKRFRYYMIPGLLIILFCIISPVACFRYILPLVMTLPVLAGIAFFMRKKDAPAPENGDPEQPDASPDLAEKNTV